MSTTHVEQDIDTSAIPSAPKGGDGVNFYKISNGEIKTKPEKGADYISVDSVEGTLKRVCIHESDYDGSVITSIEAEVEGRGGEKNIVQASAESAVGGGMFMAGLLGCKAGEFISIQAARSKEKTKFGSYLTFISIHVYDTVTRRWVKVGVDKNIWEGETWYDKLDAVKEDFRKHPDYKDRSSGGADGEYGLFLETLESKGWVLPDASADAKEAYLTWISKMLDTKVLALEDVGDDDWVELRQAVGMAKKKPAVILALEE